MKRSKVYLIDEDAESDVDDLQLAWENLEQCRNCLQLFTEEEMPWDLARCMGLGKS